MQSRQPFRYSHCTYFRLSDRTPPTRAQFIRYCGELLSGHDGTLHFSVAFRDVEMQRPVNNRSSLWTA
jgi:hypothetical protein